MNHLRTIGVVALLVPLGLSAQQQPRMAPPAAPNAVPMAFKFFAGVYGGWLQQAFDSIPASQYGFRPTPPQQTVGYIAQHLENANYGLCARFSRAKRATTARDSLPDTVKANWPKDTLVARLRQSLAFCDAALNDLTDASVGQHITTGAAGTGMTVLPARTLVGFVTDLAEHYSQVATYMRLLHLVPPSALPPRARTPIDLSVTALSQFVGQYDLPPSALQDAPAFLLDVTLKQGGLYLKPSGRPEARLWPETANDFFVKEVDVQVTFARDANGAVTGLLIHQNGESRAAQKIRR